MANYDRDHQHEEWMRRRLAEAVAHFADGSADKMGRLLGYANGGFLREIAKGVKPVGKAIVARMENVEGGAGWFAAAPGGLSAALPEAKKSTDTFSPRAARIARRLDALTSEAERAKAYARIANILDVFEAEQREAAYQAETQPAATPPTRTRTRQATPSR